LSSGNLKKTKVIPILIAERAKDNKINIFDPELETFIVYDFSPTALDIGVVTKIAEFCERNGDFSFI
jgi:type II restriction enzyme